MKSSFSLHLILSIHAQFPSSLQGLQFRLGPTSRPVHHRKIRRRSLSISPSRRLHRNQSETVHHFVADTRIAAVFSVPPHGRSPTERSIEQSQVQRSTLLPRTFHQIFYPLCVFSRQHSASRLRLSARIPNARLLLQSRGRRGHLNYSILHDFHTQFAHMSKRQQLGTNTTHDAIFPKTTRRRRRHRQHESIKRASFVQRSSNPNAVGRQHRVYYPQFAVVYF